MLPKEALDKLRSSLAARGTRKTLSTEEREVVAELCSGARKGGWTPEQLIVAVKDACYTSPEIAHLTTTSERDAFLARIVTACIEEFFREDGTRSQ